MTAQIGISLPRSTYARALDLARASSTSVSGLVDEALRPELMRREVAAHVAMLAAAEDPVRLRAGARSRMDALAAWKRKE